MIDGTIKLYQFGGYVFQEANLLNDLQTVAKTQQSNTVLINGSIRLNGNEANTVEDQNITVSFTAKDNDSLNTIKYELFGEPKKIFFVHYRSDYEIEILFNYGECTSLKDYGYDATDSNNDQFTATFRIMTPFLYRCIDNLYLLDSVAFPPADRSFWGDNITKFETTGTVWGDTTKLGVNLSFGNQTYDTMKKYFDCNCEGGYPLLYFDGYFKKEAPLVTDPSTQHTINLATAPVLFNSNSSSVNLKLDGNLENTIILLKIVASLQQNQWIELTNTANNTSVRITWLDPSILGSPNLVFSLYDFELYDLTGGNVQITDINKFRVDILGDDLFKIPSHYKTDLDPYFPVNNEIKVTTGIDNNTTTINGTLTIYNLPTYLI